ncbi:hypothetical protein UFOVP778_21 [uncultured Caudovirales phage]|uniref:Uncharacterized protein n=1 Tax=uncultured Caudovirales phage TaxID=2100421 RepID=A0A6J5NY90_9CAUD|nr:hypothetical protein UFOVP778_21 [uncultured Caudovirales phage]
MTPVQIFWKDLEKYGLIKDSQFILNIPLRLLEEIFDKAQEIHKNSEIPNLSEKPTSCQTEISDEEIEKVSNTLGDDYYASELIMWEKGAKWYREQLKKKQ